jgi:hypothetical protein
MEEAMKIKLHMKSGKTLKLKYVKDFSYRYTGDTITSIEVKYNWVGKLPKSRVFIPSVVLSQIEAIERC